MSIGTAVVLSTLLLAVTGCATSSPPPAAKQETGKKNPTKKVIKHDQERSMNEESMEAVRKAMNPGISYCKVA
jgi:Flp pilus assembly protein TadD